MTLVFWRLTSPRNSKGKIGSGGAECHRGRKNTQFSANMEGVGLPAHPPPPLWLHLCIWSNPKPATNVGLVNSSVPSTKGTLRCIGHSRSFKVILIGAGRNPLRCRNVQLMPTLFLKLTKIWQRKNSKFVDLNDPTQVWRHPNKKRLPISTKWFILPETRVLDLYFSRPGLAGGRPGAQPSYGSEWCSWGGAAPHQLEGLGERCKLP